MAAIAYAHIELDPQGAAYLLGTRIKVIEIALDRLAHHWDADEIHRQHPTLTLGQIHSALAYYYDHQAELDQAIEAGLQRVAAIRASLGASPIRAKLEAKGLLP